MIDQFCNIIFKVLNYYLSKNLQPDLTISNIKELSSDNLDNLITNGIKGLITNLDETIRLDKKDIPKCNKEWLEISKKMGIDYIGLTL